MARASASAPLLCCGLGHRVGDVPVPRRGATVTSAADTTSGGTIVSATGAPIRDPEFAKKESATAPRGRSGGSCGSVGASRARRGDEVDKRGPFPLIVRMSACEALRTRYARFEFFGF